MCDGPGHDILALHLDGIAVEIAQRGMQDGAAFGLVYRLAGKHGLPPGFDAGLIGQIEQKLPGFVIDVGLGVIQQHVIRPDRKRRCPSGRVEEGQKAPVRNRRGLIF